MHNEFIDPRLLTLLTTFKEQPPEYDNGSVKYFCHEYMRNHYLFNITEFSAVKNVTYFASHERSMANIIVRMGKFRNSISEARRNGWNKNIPLGFSDHKSSSKVKNPDIYVLNIIEPDDIILEIKWCMDEGDLIGFLCGIFYDTILLMKRMSAELSISNSVNNEVIYRELRKREVISSFLAGCRNASFINIPQHHQDLMDSLNINISDVIAMGENFVVEYAWTINKILMSIDDDSKENIFNFSRLY
jgi:hypothetical protein